MSTREAVAHARDARRKAKDTPFYDIARKLELAVEELSKEIDALKGDAQSLRAGRPILKRAW